MKILILTTSHPEINAGIVAYDLYKGLKEIKGNDVRLLTKAWDRYNDKNIISIDTDITEYLRRAWDLRRKIVKKLLKVLFGYKANEEPQIRTNPDYAVQGADQTITFYKTTKLLKRAGFMPDAVIVLFMPHFLSYKNLYELNQSTKAPVLIYCMDMAPMTAGCHYAWDCKGYQETCGNCPALYSSNEYDQSNINWEFKKKYIDKTNIFAIAGTEWQYRQLQSSSLFNSKPKHKILLGIDDELFKPGNKNNAREYFSLPPDKKIIFFGAAYYDRNRNKGFKELIEALNILKNNVIDPFTIHLAIAGHRSQPLEDKLPFEHTYLGYLNYSQLVKGFQASDLFVCPSIEDSGPMMINQSIMCGTPVVSFEMGVALDLVITGQTGYRARLGDTGDLARGMKYISQCDDQEYTKISENCRDIGLNLCHPQVQVGKIMELF
jgi:glycosyltransferase involved in cell wall biosynthesis